MTIHHRGSTWFALFTGASLLLTAASSVLVGCSSPEATPEKGGSKLSPSQADEASEDIAGQIVVDFRDSVSESEVRSVLTDTLGLAFVPTGLEAETKIEVATVSVSSEGSILDRLNHDPRVEYAEPLARVKALFVPNDPLLKSQWHLSRIGAQSAWAFSTGRGVTVAVVDTGIACEDFGGFTKGTDLAQTTCVEGYNFVNKTSHANDDQGHGTHVAGTIAQSTNNGIGGAGVSFNAKLMPVKVLNGQGSGTTADVADGIRWAADHGAQVINLSLGSSRDARVLQQAVDHAISKGVVVVAAAGNSGGSVGFPGASKGVIGVSASNSDDKLAPFSSRGDGVDIAAPGVDVVQQTICNGGQGKCERFPAFSGTSMASPHVAGAAAMLVSMGVGDPAAVEKTLQATARVVDSSEGAKKLFGAGILSAEAATRHVALTHGFVRFAALAALLAWAVHSARKTKKDLKPWRPAFLVAALLAGPGLLFFAPFLSPYPHLLVDIVSRPLADMDLLFNAQIHRWLPLGNAALPLGLTVLFFGIKRLRPALAGLSLGTAAYLVSVAFLGEAVAPFGRALFVAWCAANAVGAAWLGRFLLTEEE